MTGGRSCKGYKELVMEAMDRMIGGENKALLDAHVKICPDCRKYIADMKKIKKAVSAGYEAPFFLETRIMEEIKPVSSFWFLVSSRIKPAITFAASFGLVLIVSLLIINKGFDNKTVTIADMPVIHNTVSNSGSLISDQKTEKTAASTKSVIRDQGSEIRDLNIDSYSEHGSSMHNITVSNSGSLIPDQGGTAIRDQGSEIRDLVMLKPGVIPTTTDNPLLDKELAIVANNLINPLLGQRATIVVKVTEPANVKIIIYDKSVRPISRILDEYKDRGTYEATWEGRTDTGETVSEGVYFVYVQIGTTVIKKSIIVNK